ncbi:hypothetical protein KsCSTR_09770 [Candidatus Kuenenia stuttgartiensis]|nr:hypothetical protein KsCSTR_09770 [Candidatus Kuenenia stuttgartiensis]
MFWICFEFYSLLFGFFIYCLFGSGYASLIIYVIRAVYGSPSYFKNSHHFAFATPGNDENGFITILCCSVCA